MAKVEAGSSGEFAAADGAFHGGALFRPARENAVELRRRELSLGR
jgi:hypothetical protein